MKPLDQYETPITDSSTMRFRDGDQTIEVVDCEIARSLERRLAACREQLRSITESSSSTRLRRECKETLTLTKP